MCKRSPLVVANHLNLPLHYCHIRHEAHHSDCKGNHSWLSKKWYESTISVWSVLLWKISSSYLSRNNEILKNTDLKHQFKVCLLWNERCCLIWASIHRRAWTVLDLTHSRRTDLLKYLQQTLLAAGSCLWLNCKHPSRVKKRPQPQSQGEDESWEKEPNGNQELLRAVRSVHV